MSAQQNSRQGAAYKLTGSISLTGIRIDLYSGNMPEAIANRLETNAFYNLKKLIF